MGAIAGIFRPTGRPVEAVEIHRMLNTMPYRCVDGEGVFCEGRAGLGQGTLHTTSESLTAHQPTALADWTIAADARLDNREDLIGRLGLRSSVDHLSDSQLILEAYARWGVDCLDHLLGDFAFAIWDPSENRLFCARDHFGIRPFYYSLVDGSSIFFASEIRALLACEQVPDGINEDHIFDTLLDLRGDVENTSFSAIKRLPPGHRLMVDGDGVDLQQYYTVEPATDVGGEWSDDRYIDRFRELFEQAVECRTRSDFPVGAELSGGLDSSYVAATARDLIHQSGGRGGEPLHTFSLVFENVPDSDERPYIDAVLAQGNVEGHFVPGDRRGPLTHLDDPSSYLDECVGSGTQFMADELQLAAERANVRVLLNGIDGDTVVGHGTMRFRRLAEQGDWETFTREAVAASSKYYHADHRHPFEHTLSSDASILFNFGFPVLDSYVEKGRLIKFFRELRRLKTYYMFEWSAVLKEFARHWWRSKQSDRSNGGIEDLLQERLSVIESRWKDSGKLDERITKFGAEAYQSTDPREKQRLKLGSGHMAGGFEAYNQMASRRGMEIRYPFMDRRLIEYCVALPIELSYRDGWTRWIMRKAMDGRVPEKVTWRVGKGRMSSAYQYGLLHHDADRLRRHTLDIGSLGPYIASSEVLDRVERLDELPEASLITLATVAEVSAWMRNRLEMEAQSV